MNYLEKNKCKIDVMTYLEKKIFKRLGWNKLRLNVRTRKWQYAFWLSVREIRGGTKEK